jgi:hypothetical protein
MSVGLELSLQIWQCLYSFLTDCGQRGFADLESRLIQNLFEDLRHGNLGTKESWYRDPEMLAEWGHKNTSIDKFSIDKEIFFC